MKPFVSLVLSASLVLITVSARSAPAPLPRLGASQEGMSVSGLSSGAFMAVQYQVAYSASVVGAGVVAGGPYFCAYSLPGNALLCMGWGLVAPDPTPLVLAAQDFAQHGQIDPLSNLKRSRIYVFSGTNDLVVNQPAVDATVAFFQRVGVPPSNLMYVKNVPAGHAVLTPNFGNSCAENASPYINQCTVKKKKYDQVGEIFTQIYRTVAPPAMKLSGQILSFDQSEFTTPLSSMADEGYVYVPARCSAGVSCRIHVAFHGCGQSAQSVNDDFYTKTSYNAWADSNDIIVLYPQVNIALDNLGGCWDWWGYTGGSYALKNGVQMQAVHTMVERLNESVTATANR